LSNIDIEKINAFKPSFVWPNPAFHFRIYYESDKCRIFLIENIAHNWNWLKENVNKIRPNDYFFVQLGWHFSEHLVNECHRIIEMLGLEKKQFRIMFPDFRAKAMFEYYGFTGKIINHNCFLDENKFKIIDSEKLYDAIYTARFAEFKRHFLASKIENLALVAGNTWGLKTEEIPKYKYLNKVHLSPEEVVQKLSESKCGLILSEFEGACYSSSEYLLCGLPVVSTWSHGGRDIWFNEYNSIICDANPDAVAASVKKIINLKRDPHRIREMQIRFANEQRLNFIEMHNEVLDSVGEKKVAREYFEKNYIHKLLTSETPNFLQIFQ
jgi:glycosyltransferase involved in cell wall biosynthesis